MGLDPRWLALIEVGTATVSVGPSAVVPDRRHDRVTVSTPPSHNNLYVNSPHGGRVLSEAGRAWKASAEKLLEAMRRPERYPVTVHWVVNEWLRSNRDAANSSKALMDAMVGAEVLTDDSVSYVVGERWDYRPVEGGVGVTVWWEYADEVPAKPKRKKNPSA